MREEEDYQLLLHGNSQEGRGVQINIKMIKLLFYMVRQKISW